MWLGVSQRVGRIMLYWILTKKGAVISRKKVQRISNLEMRQTREDPASTNLIVRLSGASRKRGASNMTGKTLTQSNVQST